MFWQPSRNSSGISSVSARSPAWPNTSAHLPPARWYRAPLQIRQESPAGPPYARFPARRGRPAPRKRHELARDRPAARYPPIHPPQAPRMNGLVTCTRSIWILHFDFFPSPEIAQSKAGNGNVRNAEARRHRPKSVTFFGTGCSSCHVTYFPSARLLHAGGRKAIRLISFGALKGP